MTNNLIILLIACFLLINVSEHSFAQTNANIEIAVNKQLKPLKTLSLQTADFQGYWKSTTLTSEFNLSLTQLSNKLTGSHCSVQQSGNRIDCGIDESEVSINGVAEDSAIVTVAFKSFYGGSIGKATIKKLTSNTVEWTIIQKPQGEFYIPINAVLTKQ